MADLEELTINDSMTAVDVTIVDTNNVVKDISGWTAKLFVVGQSSGDRPESGTRVSVANATTTIGSRSITRATGSFVTDGFVAGMIVVSGAFPEGTQILAVAALAITVDADALVAHTADGTVRGWFGIDGAIVSGPAGQARFVGVATRLDIGALTSDVYTGKVRGKDGASSEVGWTNSARGEVAFRAVRP